MDDGNGKDVDDDDNVASPYLTEVVAKTVRGRVLVYNMLHSNQTLRFCFNATEYPAMKEELYDLLFTHQ